MNIGVGTITVDAQAAYIRSAKGLTATTDDVASGSGQVFGCDGTNFATLATNYNETGSAVWGSITGTLSSQTDLQSALDAKADESITVTGTGMLAGGGDLTANRTITLAATNASTILGNNTAGSAVPIAMTVAQTKALLAYTPADIGAIASTRSITDKASSDTLLVANTSKGYTNTGAGAEVELTLPASAVGLSYFFIVTDTDGLKIRCPASTTITVGTTVSSAAGYTVSTAIGSTLTIVCYESNKWVAVSVTGTWTTA